ncbi:DegT/DnrJ/EryC1/StrS aminotransferase family protein [Flavobacterium sp.]|uniref:DegT/DnrJ/EryC1/StrS family aminotransferase n=1 Tax=Flavobacterium sp. TaxID=239 RepID=UPI00260C9B3F|nr:DegT/DnrJ/EryC1/StrS family aminotransferase [Flavobacterium sp.]
MIPFLDLQKVNERYAEAYHQKLDEVLQKGWFILGDAVQQFETEFAAFCQARHTIGVGNGLDAITLLLRAYIQLGRLQEGDHIIVPANTYIATILGIQQAGLVPVLVEPDPVSFTLCPIQAKRAITPQVKGIMVVHLYGQRADMPGLAALATEYDLALFEDAAQAHGISFYGNYCKTFSFYPGKNLGALGDAGAVVTDNPEVAAQVRLLRNYGSPEKYVHSLAGTNSRLDELQAAFLQVRLPHLLDENEHRRQLAARYSAGIVHSQIQLPQVVDPSLHAFHLYVIRTPKREALQAYLLAKGIQTMIHYPIAPHQQAALKHIATGPLPITEQLHREVLSLPISPVLTYEEQQIIIDCLNAFPG